ncbi:hypothetical protein R69619_04583 [Paraburkholderia nemoris]|uniref:hypothetical protein n=1 Tax=Paraburkholderia nemoris TaxID=2793076 RepID=UPI00190A7180|nr:hypothetical protein [Paraburkholderia nemoris]MBK3742580.1 hypothetical protein [Paraburkholderia aspalathi]CAE6787234.1 hypothetical protein R69619_04583 [Paraburkholderia nemoris]
MRLRFAGLQVFRQSLKPHYLNKVATKDEIFFMQRRQKGFLAILCRRNLKTLDGISESHREHWTLSQPCDRAYFPISDIEITANPTQRLNLKYQLLTPYIPGTCGTF